MLADVLETFRRWQYLPDPAALYAVLAAVAANRFEGRDPLWLAVVGPPGGGKSEILQSLFGLEDVEQVGTIKESALLSGTRKADQAKGATGGMLRKYTGDKTGILVSKDFGSILEMHPEDRRRLLQALREIYDGSWVRDLGVDGHTKLYWKGKIGLIVGATPMIDRHHAAMAAMGERLVMLRLPKVDPKVQGMSAWEIGGSEEKMRAELRETVKAFFDIPRPHPEPTSPQQGDAIVDLAILVTRCRSAVVRDNYTREIELIPEPEAPTRLTTQLDRMFSGLRAIGMAASDAWPITVRVGLDSMPVVRRMAIEALVKLEELSMAGAAIETADVVREMQYPRTTVDRTLQDLGGHGVVFVYPPASKGQPTKYELNPKFAELYRGLRAQEAKAVAA